MGLGPAPPAAQVRKEVADLVGAAPWVAHNAGCDSNFLDADWARIGHRREQAFACSMLLARRLYPQSPNHKLGTLVTHLGLPDTARHHRALADAEMTAHLWLRMVSDLKNKHGLELVTHEFLCALQKVPKAKLTAYIEKFRRAA